LACPGSPPFVGHAIITLRDPRLYLLVFVAPLLLVAAGLSRIWKQRPDVAPD